MKTTFLISLLVVLFSVSSVAQKKQLKETHEKNESKSQDWDGDHPERAMEQEMELTKDPILGIVPKERLIRAMELSKQQRSKNNSQSQLQSTASWIELGPNNIGGRTRAIMFDPNDATHKKVWAGGVDGGLWYTNDITVPSPIWINVDDFWANLAITCIAYSPADPQVFYVGTGEGWFNSDAVRGFGIWKSINGGLTWTQLLSTSTDPNNNFDYIQKIVIHPVTGAVFAATGSQFCNRGGLFRSLDNGNSWSLILGTQGGTCATSNGGAADVEIGSDGTVYASLGIRQVANGTLAGGIYKSTNAGDTWSLITGNGFPTSGYQRIEIAVAPSDANRIYAMVQGSANALLNIYTSANKGASWTTCQLPAWRDQSCGSPSSDMTRSQSWYDLILAVDPNDPNSVLAGGVDIMKTSNAGTSWTQISNWAGACGYQFMHADQHAIVYQPGSSSNVVFGNDGGVYYSNNVTAGTPIFNNVNIGYNVTQFYSCAIHPTAGQSNYLAGAQDNGTQKFTNPGMNSTSPAFGGDGAFCFIDQTNGAYQISSYVYNNFYRTTDNWATLTQILSSTTNGTVGRFINPADYDDANHILYTAYSTTQVSRVSGVTNPSPNAEVRITITGMSSIPTHIRVSPFAPVGTTTLFVGTGNGSLYKVTNAQGVPVTTNITGLGGPWGTTASISCVEIGASENNLLVTFSNYGVISVYRSTNGGFTWTSVEGNLPDMPVRWAVYNPNDLNEVYLATELGIWSTPNITAVSPAWVANNNNLANVSVRMLQYRNSDKEMIAATHGRGLFTTRVFSPPPASPPTAAFTSDVTTLACGGDVVFTDQSTLAFEWLWDFGDGTTSEFQNPIHNFTTPGVYNVKLTVTNTLGSNFVVHQITVNPPFTLSASATPSSLCLGESTQLNAVASGSTNQSYLVSNISFAPVAGAGTAVPLSDDQVSSAKPIGFTFRFFGKNYTNFYISSNGLITFNPSMPASPVYGQLIPSPSDPDNFISLCWNDLNPENAGSTISYFTTGVAPNQRLIVNYNTSHFGGVQYPFVVQAILYEGTNVIEIHTTTISNVSAYDPSATTTQGIENSNGTAGLAVPGRNGVVFSAANDAYRFTPYEPYSYTWNPGNLSGTNQTVSPVNSTTYTVQVSDGSTCVTQTSTVPVTVFISDDGNVCTNDFCNSITGVSHTNVPDGTAGADDGNACTLDVCVNGNTTHTSNSFVGSTTIAKWTFEGVAFNASTSQTPSLSAGFFIADQGNQTTGSAFTGNHLGASSWTTPTGNGSTKSLSANTWGVGDYFQFLVNTASFTNLIVSFDEAGSGTGPRDFKLQYSTDGINFTDFNSYTVLLNGAPNGSWTSGFSIPAYSYTFNLSAITNLNSTTAYFRITNTSTTSINGSTIGAGGTSRLDNFTVKGTLTQSIDDSNACTLDGCDTSTGNFHNSVNTDDGNACTDDGCDSSTGIFHNPVNTDDGNACTDDGCNTSTGVYHNPVNTDDGNVCTDDGCDPSTGIFHNPVNTDDGNACTDDGCDSSTGIYHNPVNTDDNNSCTTDGCDNITGVYHNAVNPDDGNPCTNDGCDVLTGIYHTPVNTDDGDACTSDGCDTSTGIFHDPVNTDDGNVCTTDGCNTDTGIYHTNVPDGTAGQDDGNACTIDICINGNTVHTPNSIVGSSTIAKWTFENVAFFPAPIFTPLLSAGSYTADQGNQTAGSAFSGIHASGATVWSTPNGNGSLKSMSSNNFNIGDYYQFLVSTISFKDLVVSFDVTGSITGPRDFKLQYSSDGNSFSDFTSYSVLLNGGPPNATWNIINYNAAYTFTFNLSSITSLNNTNAYFRIVDNSPTSIGGSPVGTGGTNRIDNVTINGILIPSIDDNNACTIDGCDPITGDYHNAVNTDDGNVCTTDDCNINTGEITHTPVNVDDGNACTDDGCDSSTGIYHTPVNTDDGNVCTDDGCDNTSGVYHIAVNIDDNNACTNDGCDSTTGVYHNQLNTDDANVCTDDGCDTSTGVYHNPVNTDDGIACTIDGCDSNTGVFHTPDNCNVTLYSNIFLEGYYIGGGMMNNCLFATGVSNDPTDADYITISAMNPTPPYTQVDSKIGTLKTNGNVSVTFDPSVISGNSYYLKITHRNAITTWSASPVLFSTNTTYIFSDDSGKAFGSNQIGTHLVGASTDGFGFAFYSGDIADGNPPGSGVQDGSIDATDFLDLDPFIQNGDGGYIIADLNGDGSVDATDFLVIDPNIQQGVGSATP